MEEEKVKAKDMEELTTQELKILAYDLTEEVMQKQHFIRSIKQEILRRNNKQ